MFKLKLKATGESVPNNKYAITPERKVLLLDDEQHFYLADEEEYELIEYPIPTKEQFRKLISDIKAINQKQESLNQCLSQISSDSILFFPTLENSILRYLTEVFDDKCDWIYYFICELDFGEKWTPGTITEDNKNIPLKNTDDLYELLIGNISN